MRDDDGVPRFRNRDFESQGGVASPGLVRAAGRSSRPEGPTCGRRTRCGRIRRGPISQTVISSGPPGSSKYQRRSLPSIVQSGTRRPLASLEADRHMVGDGNMTRRDPLIPRRDEQDVATKTQGHAGRVDSTAHASESVTSLLRNTLSRLSGSPVAVASYHAPTISVSGSRFTHLTLVRVGGRSLGSGAVLAAQSPERRFDVVWLSRR